MPTPDARPAPGDNVLDIRIHAYRLNADGTDTEEIKRTLAVRVTATNGAGENTIQDDNGTIIQPGRRAIGNTPWPLTLSQPPDAPHPGIGVSIRAEVQPFPDDKGISLVCNFFVNGVEDVKNAQASTGRQIVCLYRTGF